MTSFMRYGINSERSMKALFGKVILVKVFCRKARNSAANGSQDMKHNELRVMLPRNGEHSQLVLARSLVELQ